MDWLKEDRHLLSSSTLMVDADTTEQGLHANLDCESQTERQRDRETERQREERERERMLLGGGSRARLRVRWSVAPGRLHTMYPPRMMTRIARMYLSCVSLLLTRSLSFSFSLLLQTTRSIAGCSALLSYIEVHILGSCTLFFYWIFFPPHAPQCDFSCNGFFANGIYTHSARDVRVRLGLVALPFPSRASGDKICGR